MNCGWLETGSISSLPLRTFRKERRGRKGAESAEEDVMEIFRFSASSAPLHPLRLLHRRPILRRPILARLWMLMVGVLLLPACNSTPAPTALSLSFIESGPEGERPLRMLVTGDYLRIEDGDAASGYILFDRRTGTVYSVSHGDRTVLTVRSVPVTLTPPRRFQNTVARAPEPLPAVDGRAVIHYQLLTNGERCADVYAADGLLPEAVAALREYHQALAATQARGQAGMPAAFQSACDLAEFVFLPARHLEYGFPVRQVNRAGVTRQLVDYKTDAPIETKLFEVPKDYRQITPSEIR